MQEQRVKRIDNERGGYEGLVTSFKTFTAYQLALEMGWKKLLVLTFKPAVQNAWEEDLLRHKDFQQWQFVSKNGMSID